VAGGTGVVGRHVVRALAAGGDEAVVLARSAGVDLMDRAAVTAALEGCEAVIDVASVDTLSAARSVAFFRATTANLLAAGEAHAVRHHVALSIVGAAAAPYGYYAGKRAQEDLVSAARVGWSVLRATQFHEFAAQTVRRGTVMGLALVPVMRAQTVAAVDVADELVRLALGAPRGFAGELAGREEHRMAELVRRYLKATGDRRRVLEVPLPGAFGKALRDGTVLPGPGAKLGTRTFEEWLAGL
jgi:uncharacterized protein YbjT (DUF2867 family)